VWSLLHGSVRGVAIWMGKCFGPKNEVLKDGRRLTLYKNFRVQVSEHERQDTAAGLCAYGMSEMEKVGSMIGCPDTSKTHKTIIQ